jgi:hypothetical protein
MAPTEDVFKKHLLRRIERLEIAVFGTRGEESRKVAKTGGKAGTLPDQLLRERDEGFFDTPKTPGETHVRLQPRYPCDPDRVAMALLRLQRRRKLRKASKAIQGKRHLAYVR